MRDKLLPFSRYKCVGAGWGSGWLQLRHPGEQLSPGLCPPQTLTQLLLGVLENSLPVDTRIKMEGLQIPVPFLQISECHQPSPTLMEIREKGNIH